MIKASVLLGMSGLLGTVAISQPLVLPPAKVADDHADPRDIVGMAKVSLSTAIQNALVACPGTAVEAELEGELEDNVTVVFFEVMVVSKKGRLVEVKLDAASGSVTSQEDVSEGDEAGELKSFRHVLRHTELSLSQLLAKASEVVHGYPFKAALEFEDGQPQCEIGIVNGRLVIDADLEARAGHVVDLELASMSTEHRDEQDSEAGDEDEDEDEDKDDAEHEEEEEEEEEGEAQAEAHRVKQPAKQPAKQALKQHVER